MRATSLAITVTRSLDETRARDDDLPVAPTPEMATEWELVRRAQGYDEDALKQLYETYYPKIYNYAFMQMGDVQAAEDLASDVMLKMIESIQSYKFRGLPFGAWVFRIARNRLIDLPPQAPR
jgi:RNA polymerase sigma-70 factor (ECF subfamily)